MHVRSGLVLVPTFPHTWSISLPDVLFPLIASPVFATIGYNNVVDAFLPKRLALFKYLFPWANAAQLRFEKDK